MRGSFGQQADDLDLPGEPIRQAFYCGSCDIDYFLEASDAPTPRAFCSKECEAADAEEDEA